MYTLIQLLLNYFSFSHCLRDSGISLTMQNRPGLFKSLASSLYLCNLLLIPLSKLVWFSLDKYRTVSVEEHFRFTNFNCPVPFIGKAFVLQAFKTEKIKN